MSEASGHDFSHLPPAAAGLGHIFSRPRLIAGFCVIALAGLGWFYAALLLVGMGGSFEGFGGSVVQALCRPLANLPWGANGITIIVLMWGAMTLAMMLPSAAPMIMTYAGIADTAARKNESIVSPVVLLGGYTAIWFAFAIVAALAQILLTKAALLDSGMGSASGLFSGAIFIGAGFYQFSALKHSCLTHCQQPFPFFLANWATSPAGVFRLGLTQGVYCLGCCWAMMLLMFAVGVMNVIWMAGLGMLMTIEKMLAGSRFTHAIGVVLITIGVCTVVAAFAGHWPALAS
jgi:predicted metal-binding membrane protein